MTLAPFVSPDVRGVKGAPGLLGPICAAPGCASMAQQRHHLWPKSYLRGQPYEWVAIGDILIQNSTGLCITHHNEVTGMPGGHKAHIRWNSGLQVLEWWEQDTFGVGGHWTCLGLLDGEDAPLVHGLAVFKTEAEVEREKEDLCPTCGKPKKKKEHKPRKTKTWAVQVPDDAEDGAAVLDEYVDDLSVAMGYGDESKGVRRFHVLANVLLWVTQVKPEFLADWSEADRA